MNNGYGVLIFIGIIILGVAAAHEYTRVIGFTVIAFGFIGFGLVGAILNYLDGNRP